MSRNGRHRFDDPVNDVVTELYHELSEHLGTDGPEETFGHPDENVVGRLVEEDEGARTDVTSEVLAFDSHDIEDLTAEEAAIHLVVDGEEAESPRDPSLTRSVREALKEF
jgi:hypothetical protein